MQSLYSATTGHRLAKRRLTYTATMLAVSSLLAMPTLAQADYLYQYTGNEFTVSTTAQTYVDLGGDNFIYIPVTTTYQARITASVYTPTLLTSSSSLADGIHFTVTGSKEYGGPITLEFPKEFPFDPSYYPQNSGVFTISSVGADNLPTGWNIGISQYIFLGGRGHLVDFSTSTALDAISGYDEPFIVFSGSLENSPGSWKVSVVPEPESYAMLLAGLGLIGYSARRRKAIKD